MGSPSSEEGRFDDEGPQHQVTFSSAFAVGRFPLTRDEYIWFASETSRPFIPVANPGFAQTGRDPVVNVSWDDAKAYVAWLSGKTGHTYRLLSESEYEYAERAGTTTAYWWGDNEDERCSHANFAPAFTFLGEAGCGHDGTVPVGSYPANAFGLYDMTGNVWEWTEDCWNDSYAGAPDDGTAWTTGDCGARVLRGGSWYNDSIRSAYRDKRDPTLRDPTYGFRVARTF